MSHDKWNQKRKNIYRVETHETWTAKTFYKATCNPVIGPNLQNEFPEIESFVRFAKFRNAEVRIEDSKFNEEFFFYADTSVFFLFPYKLIA